jgi:drug/metabolite transporter (DMT)-like permease
MPDWWLMLVLLICGLIGGTAYAVQMAALARAPASLLAPFQYSQFLWGLLFGAMFFSELPDFIGFVGVAIVITSGVGSALADNIRARVALRWAQKGGVGNELP